MDINKIKELAEKNNPKAQNELGIAYMTGDGVECDEQKGFYWFKRAVDLGFLEALANYGMCFLFGKGVSKDIDYALFILESAYLLGIDHIVSYILEAILTQELNIEEITTLADSGSVRAMWVLGLCYERGLAVEKNVEKATDLLEKAAQNDNPFASWALASSHVKADGDDLLYAKLFLDGFIESVEKVYGFNGYIANKRILNVIDDVNKRFQKERPFLLMKVIPECKTEGEPKDKYVQDLLDGKLYMKTLDQFGDIKKRDSSSKNDFRGDILEGYAESFGTWYNPHLYKIRIDGNEIEPSAQLGSIDVLALRKKVYCLSVIDYHEPTNGIVKPSEKMKEFGKYAVIITDVEEFLKRVRKAFRKYCKVGTSYRLAYNRVSYDVNMFDKIDYSEFHKTRSYSWQNEFRISLDFTEGKFSPSILENVTYFAKIMFPREIELDKNPLSLSDWIYFEIGDIRDICECIETDQLFNGESMPFGLKNKPTYVKPYEMPNKPRPTFCKGVSCVILPEKRIRLAISEEAFYYAEL